MNNEIHTLHQKWVKIVETARNTYLGMATVAKYGMYQGRLCEIVGVTLNLNLSGVELVFSLIPYDLKSDTLKLLEHPSKKPEQGFSKTDTLFPPGKVTVSLVQRVADRRWLEQPGYLRDIHDMVPGATLEKVIETYSIAYSIVAQSTNGRFSTEEVVSDTIAILRKGGY